MNSLNKLEKPTQVTTQTIYIKSIGRRKEIMLKFINLKKLTATGILALMVTGALIAKSSNNIVSATPGCNNGIGNNFDVPYILRGQTYTITIDPGNNGQMKKFRDDLKTAGFNDLEIASAVAQLVDAEMRANANCPGASSSSSSSSISSTAPILPAPSTPVPTRALINPSFEYPAFTGTNWYSLDNYVPGDSTTLQGWFSTHPTTDFSGDGDSRYKYPTGHPLAGQNFKHLVEIWANNFNGVAASNGTQFAELNAQSSSALYQDILVFAGEEIPWSASHRGRGSASTADIAEVFISDPNNWTGATFSGTKLYSTKISTANDGNPQGISNDSNTIGRKGSSSGSESLSNGWVKYSDTWVGPSVTKKYRFAFQSVSTGSGNNTVGNFLDDIQIKLSSVVDLVNPNISQVNPTGNSVYYLPVRINGKLESSATVEINVSLAGSNFTNYTLNTLASGTNGAVTNGVTATKLANGNIQVTIPAGLYDPNNPSQYISVPINLNQALSTTDKTATFTIVGASGGSGSGVQNMLIPPADSDLVKTLSTTVKSVNGLPYAQNDNSNVNENQDVTVSVLNNDSDPDGDTLSVTASNPANGQVTVNPDRTVTYTPSSNYYGNDSFSYTISDGKGGQDTATVNVTVISTNAAPLANNDTASTFVQRSVTIDVLANDTDAESDQLSIGSVSNVTGGTHVVENNKIVYTAGSVPGTYSLDYTVSDGRRTDTGSVTITVNAVSD
jgi:Bacterial Ig domain